MFNMLITVGKGRVVILFNISSSCIYKDVLLVLLIIFTDIVILVGFLVTGSEILCSVCGSKISVLVCESKIIVPVCGSQ